MAERQVTADGESRPLPDPFLILATENPLEHEGTFPLPEAQLDRFFLKATLGYPTIDDEVRIVQAQLYAHPLSALGPAIDIAELHRIQHAVSGVYIDPIILRWLIELVRATRELDVVSVGASVRASLALERAVRAWALLHARPFVEPDDVVDLFEPVVAHRVILNPFRLAGQQDATGAGPRRLVDRCLERVPRPGIVPAAEDGAM
jgi:MoxR-like ATPase